MDHIPSIQYSFSRQIGNPIILNRSTLAEVLDLCFSNQKAIDDMTNMKKRPHKIQTKLDSD